MTDGRPDAADWDALPRDRRRRRGTALADTIKTVESFWLNRTSFPPAASLPLRGVMISNRERCHDMHSRRSSKERFEEANAT